MKARLQPSHRTGPFWLPLVLALFLAQCASTQPELQKLAAPEEPPKSAERTAAVAEIRSKAEAARQSDTGSEDGVYDAFGPASDDRLTYAEIRDIEAELDALAEATRQATDPGEIAALRRRADRLEALRSQIELDDEAASGSSDQSNGSNTGE